MPWLDREFLQTPIFEIFAGSEPEPLLVHAGILSKSDRLKAIIEGNWEETLARKINLGEWDVDTVKRWVEWLYTGNYTGAFSGGSTQPSSKSSSLPSEASQQLSRNHQTSAFLSARVNENFADPGMNDGKPYVNQEGPLPFFDLAFPGAEFQRHKHLAILKSIIKWRLDSRPKLQDSDFTAIAFSHAKVYCLADYMLLPDLQALAFENIKAWLGINWPPRPTNTLLTSLIPLIRYVYAGTPLKHNDGGEEPLRLLLATYMALHGTAFEDNQHELADLLSDCGDFAVDLWSKATIQMKTLTADIEKLKIEKRKLEDQLRSVSL
ncbi:hypothetical protein ACLMJK_005780 [Lecanora helva]